jgi:hypothetical protein
MVSNALSLPLETSPHLLARRPLSGRNVYEKMAEASHFLCAKPRGEPMERVTISMSDAFAAELAAFVKDYSYEIAPRLCAILRASVLRGRGSITA